MVKRFAFALIIGCLGLALSACSLAVTCTPSAPSPTSLTAKATLPPARAPTAVPLWTATLSSQPTPVPAQSGKSAVTPAATKLDPSLVALVNGTPITRADYERQLAQAQVYFLKQPGLDIKTEAGKQALQRFQEQILGWMIDQAIIAQAAATRGIVITGEQIEAEIARMKGNDPKRFESWLASNGLTLDALRQQIRSDLITAAMRDSVTKTLPRKMMQVHARHILLSDEAAAQATLKRLKQGQNFIAVAREVSEDEMTRASGGDLGFLPKGVMPPAFDEIAFSLKPGTISEVVQSESGFHIIQVIEIDSAREVAPELWPMVQQRAFDDWLKAERAKAKIQINSTLDKN